MDQSLKKLGEDRRSAIMEFLRGYREERGYSPTQAEIARHLGVSVTCVQRHVRILTSQGDLTFEAGAARTLVPVDA